jgi:hypothetical protein
MERVRSAAVNQDISVSEIIDSDFMQSALVMHDVVHEET